MGGVEQGSPYRNGLNFDHDYIRITYSDCLGRGVNLPSSEYVLALKKTKQQKTILIGKNDGFENF